MNLPRRITALEPDPTRPGAIRVLVDGRVFCTVHERGVAQAALVVGESWDTHEAAATAAADQEAAWRALLRALERRSFAIGGIRRRLRQKGHPPEAIDYAVARGLADRLLDDAAYAEQYVASRAARGRGPSRLRQDLRLLGVEDRLIDAALRAQWPEAEAPLDLARALVVRRNRQLGALPRDVKRRRLLAYLARRGFTGEPIRRLVQAAVAHAEH